MPADKVAIVTGASRGIGRACALELARKGFAIYLVAEGTREDLEAVAAECTAAHPQKVASQFGLFDLSGIAAPELAVEAALKAFRRVDVLVNNAGIRVRHPFGEYNSAEFDRLIAINLRAAFFMSQAVLPAMRAQKGGRILFMASQLGMVADPQAALYGLSKAAMISLARSMAFELATENIMVNAVSPGPILTEFYRKRLEEEPGLLEHRLNAIPMKRLGKEEEIAEVIGFLATTNATFIQGHNLVVDGGFIIH